MAFKHKVADDKPKDKVFVWEKPEVDEEGHVVFRCNGVPVMAVSGWSGRLVRYGGAARTLGLPHDSRGCIELG